MSRVERLLKAIIQNGSYDEERLSRVEDILYAFLKDHEYTKDPESRMEALLIFLKEKKLYDDVTLSRVEDILKAKIDGVEYTKQPESRVEELLIMWDVIREYDRYISGTLPLHLTDSIGADLVDWSITGDTVQNGTPSPENPVSVLGVGDRTENLFPNISDYTRTVNGVTVTIKNNVILLQGNCTGLSIIVNPLVIYELDAGTYTMSSVGSGSVTNNNSIVQIMSEDGATRIGDQVKLNGFSTFTISEKIKIRFRIIVYADTSYECSFKLMLNEGSTPLPYEPFGVKIPVVSRGKNLFDGKIEQGGYFDSDGSKVDLSTRLRNTNPVRVFPNTRYAIRTNDLLIRHISFYDKNLRFISSVSTTSSSYTATTPENTSYLKFALRKPNDTNITPDDFEWLQVEEGPSATPYEPYRPPVTTTQYLPTPLMANERLTPSAREVKWGVKVFDGSESAWSNQEGRYDSDTKTMFAYKEFYDATVSMLSRSSHFRWYTTSQTPNAPAGTFAQNQTEATKNYFYFNISNEIIGVSKDSTKEEKQNAFKQWLKSEYDAGHPATVYYLLQTPTSEPVTTTPIGTLDGECWIDVDTEVRPVSMSATYKSSKPDNDMQLLMELFKEV